MSLTVMPPLQRYLAWITILSTALGLGWGSSCEEFVAEPYYLDYFHSPGSYPSHYPSRLDSCWKVSAPDSSHQVFLETVHVQTESNRNVPCSWADYIEIRDGPSDDSPLLIEFCGNAEPEGQNSSTSALYIRFRSDASVNEGGFLMRYHAYIPGVWDNVTDPYNTGSIDGDSSEEGEDVPGDETTFSFEEWWAQMYPEMNPEPPTDEDDGRLSGGIVTAIVIGVLAFIILVLVSVYQFRQTYMNANNRYRLRPDTERPGSAISRCRTPGITSRGTLLVNTNAENVAVVDLTTAEKKKAPRPKTAPASRHNRPSTGKRPSTASSRGRPKTGKKRAKSAVARMETGIINKGFGSSPALNGGSLGNLRTSSSSSAEGSSLNSVSLGSLGEVSQASGSDVGFLPPRGNLPRIVEAQTAWGPSEKPPIPDTTDPDDGTTEPVAVLPPTPARVVRFSLAEAPATETIPYTPPPAYESPSPQPRTPPPPYNLYNIT